MKEGDEALMGQTGAGTGRTYGDVEATALQESRRRYAYDAKHYAAVVAAARTIEKHSPWPFTDEMRGAAMEAASLVLVITEEQRP